MRIAAILLAAGASCRFGADDKLLAPIDGVALVRRTADVLAASATDPILAVVAPNNRAVARVLDGARVTLVDNARHATGMGTSIAAGIRALPADTEGALLVPADMPALSTRLVERIVAAFRTAHGERIVHAVDSAGAQRNPVLWPRRHFHRLAALDGEAGGKAILARLADEATTVRADDDHELDDIDTPEDLARWTDRRPGTGTGRRT
jgi:molybdenum cofactor cytidylyltransferase